MLSSIGSCSGAGRRAASLSSFEVDRNPSDGNFTWKVRRWMSRDQPRSFLVVAIFCYTNFDWLVPVTCTCKLMVKLIWVEAGPTTPDQNHGRVLYYMYFTYTHAVILNEWQKSWPTYFELNKKPAFVKRISVLRHAFIQHHFRVVCT